VAKHITTDLLSGEALISAETPNPIGPDYPRVPLDTYTNSQYCSFSPIGPLQFSFKPRLVAEDNMRNLLCFLTLALCLSSSAVAQPSPAAKPVDDPDKPRAFITDSESWEYISNAGGGGGAFAAHGSGGARPQTAEIVKTFGERCPQVVTNNKIDKSDYVVVLDHEGGKSFVRHKNKVAVFNRISGDSVVSKSTLSLGGSVQDACEAINKDWSAHAKEIRAAAATASTPPEAKLMPAATDRATAGAPPQPRSTEPDLAATAQLEISSAPNGADIEIDGNYVGNTPSTVGATPGQHQISLKKSGFKPWERKLTVSSGQIKVNATLEAESK
jgi:hypothetical protein